MFSKYLVFHIENKIDFFVGEPVGFASLHADWNCYLRTINDGN